MLRCARNDGRGGCTGYDYIFYLAVAGGLVSTYLFAFRLPHIRHAPR